MNQPKKEWWAPVRTGLVMDADAKHYRKMKNALWLFLYLILAANRQTGVLIRKTRTISSDTGISRDTIIRWLNTLRKEGYIETASTGRYLMIRIRLWKTLTDVGNTSFQRWQKSDTRSWKYPTSQFLPEHRNSAYLSQESKEPFIPNDRPINNILNNDIDKSRSAEKRLAFEIAHTLHDLPGLPLYLSCAYKYPESFLRETMEKVLKTPAFQIKKSKGAFFNYLVRKYGNEAKNMR